MKIKLLHAVMHDGYRVEAGEVGDIDEAIAKPLIASGAAEEVAEGEPAPPMDLPERLLVPEAGTSDAKQATAAAPSGEVGTAAGATPATSETPPAENAEVASAEAAPTAEDTQADPGKAAKTKGSK